ncbi:MAG: hypothetical protein KBD78_09230 [Oligoflexales bacterium]|nr:hypothetical protein [Oligoflexales bacterium]
MKKPKSLAKEVRSPDVVQLELIHVLDWMLRYKVYLISLLFVIIAGVGGFFAYGEWQSSKELKLAEEVAKIDAIQQKEIESADKLKEPLRLQLEIIEKQLTSEPDNDLAKATNKKPLTDAEKNSLEAKSKDLEQQIEKIKPDYSASLAAYTKFFNLHEKEKAGWLSGFKAMAILLEQDKKTEAKELLNRINALSLGSSFYQTQGRLNLIGILEDESKFKEALLEIDSLIKTAPKELQPYVLMVKARIEYSMNDFKAVEASIQKILSEHPESQEARQAKSLRVLIN